MITVKNLEFKFTGEIWRHHGKGGWHFITLPKKLSIKIREIHQESEEGWGRLKTEATVKQTTWKTSLWFDTKAGAYLLPLKSQVRKKEKLDIGSKVVVVLKCQPCPYC